eukprot:155105_1
MKASFRRRNMSSDQVACLQYLKSRASSIPPPPAHPQPIPQPNYIFRIPEAPSKGFLKHTTSYLFCGYIRRSCCHFALPTVINNLICAFFVGKNWKKIKFDDIIPSCVDPCHDAQIQCYRHELCRTILNILCPGPHPSNEYWLSTMIDYIFNNRYNHRAALKAYVQVLSILTDFCDFYFNVDHDKYNVLLIKSLWRFVSDRPYVLPLLCKLLAQHVGFYTIFSNIITPPVRQGLYRTDDSHHKLTWSELCAINRFTTNTDILNVRHLFSALLQKNNLVHIPWPPIAKTGIDQHIFAMFSSWTWHVQAPMERVNYKVLPWLWLRREIVYFISHSHDSLPHAQLLLDKLVTMLLNANREIDSSEIVFHVIYLLLEKTDLKISDDIRDSLFQREQWKWFVNGFLRDHQHGIVAWKLLESEEIQIDGNLLSYIQSKTGLLQRNVVSQLAVLQGKEEGDIECARNTLEIATKVCYEIHKFVASRTVNNLSTFARLYKKLEATKLIKPIIHKLKDASK